MDGKSLNFWAFIFWLRCTYKPVKHLRWSFCENKKAPSQVLDRVLNTPLHEMLASSRWQMFFKLGILKNFCKIHKRTCYSFFVKKLKRDWKETPTQVFSCAEKVLRTSFLPNPFGLLLLHVNKTTYPTNILSNIK